MSGTGRERTGSVYKHGDHLDVRITYPDGSRSKPRCLDRGTSEARAREIAQKMTDDAIKHWPEIQRQIEERRAARGAVETVKAWSERWCADRRARGLATVGDDEGRLTKWILPEIGSKPIAGPARVSKADIEALVEKLDQHVREARMHWKTATNVWGNITKMFKDACSAKTKSLRVRDDNPALGVVGPDKGSEKAKSYLYPSEVSKLVDCPTVPLRWRRVFVVAVYLYARVGELEALTVSDVDLEHGLVHIHRALDRESGKFVETKTGIKRRIPIEPHVRPLLELLCAEARAAGRALLLVMPPESDLSPNLRRYLRLAGVDREDLFANDLTRKQITFHDLRATGITWMAVRGDAPQRIQSRAGHERFETTRGYIREAENLEGAITPEETFPALPGELVTLPSSSEGPADWARLRGAMPIVGRPQRDSNPPDGLNPAADGHKGTEAPAPDGSGSSDNLAKSGNSDADDDDPLSALRAHAEAVRRSADLIGGVDGTLAELLASELLGDLDAIARRRAS